MPSLISARFFCEHCQRETHFVPIQFALALTGVSRSTMYYWMDRRWIHWRELPSRRRIICKESLSRPSARLVGTALGPNQVVPAPLGPKPVAAATSVPKSITARPKLSDLA